MSKFLLCAALAFLLYITLNFNEIKNTTAQFPIFERIVFDAEKHNQNYESLKQNIKTLNAEINAKTTFTEKQRIKLAQQKLSKTLVDSIFNYWYGTNWDFNGTTRSPRKGQIACGYFVTTTIKDAGFDIKRIKLAQSAASKIIENLCEKNSIKRFSKKAALLKHLEKIADYEVLIVGLDYHVGFIVKQNGIPYFIHSDVYFPSVVKKEEVKNSANLSSSKTFMIGNFSANDALFKKWLNS